MYFLEQFENSIVKFSTSTTQELCPTLNTLENQKQAKVNFQPQLRSRGVCPALQVKELPLQQKLASKKAGGTTNSRLLRRKIPTKKSACKPGKSGSNLPERPGILR